MRHNQYPINTAHPSNENIHKNRITVIILLRHSTWIFLKMSAHDYPSWHILKLVYLPIKRLNFHKNVGFFFFPDHCNKPCQNVKIIQNGLWKWIKSYLLKRKKINLLQKGKMVIMIHYKWWWVFVLITANLFCYLKVQPSYQPSMKPKERHFLIQGLKKLYALWAVLKKLLVCSAKIKE